MISHAFAQEKSASISNGSAQSETDGHYRRLSHLFGADDWLMVDPNMGQNIIPSYWFCWVSIARHRIFARWSILTYFDPYDYCHDRSRGYRFGSFAKIFRARQDLGLLFVWLRHWAVLWEKVRGLLGRSDDSDDVSGFDVRDSVGGWLFTSSFPSKAPRYWLITLITMILSGVKMVTVNDHRWRYCHGFYKIRA